MKSRKLLVVDDHPVVLEGVRVVLAGEGYEVLKAGTAEEAEAIVEANGDIELLVVDLTLENDADGLALIKTLRTGRSRIPAVIYTMHEEMWNISTLIDADVEGVVLKGEDVNELIEAVRLVSKGAIYRSPEFCDRFESVKKARGILSQTDLDVLRLISDGLSSSEISKRVNLSDKSVEYHRSNIIKKLGTKNMTEAIRNAVKLGIISCVAAIAPISSYGDDLLPHNVDLGLSVQWADRNLEASSPLEAGGYYAFGEVEEKDLYTWSTYRNCEDGDMFSQTYFGEESICGTQYDAAYEILGDEWRMPNNDEILELMNECTWELFDVEPRRYYRVTGPSGNYIDLPVVGYMSNDHLVYDNVECYQWSGDFELEEGEEDGFVYRLNGPYILAISYGREPMCLDASSHLGMQIRPVYVGTTGVSAISSIAKRQESIYSIDGTRLATPQQSLAPGLYIINGKKTLIR